MDLAEIWKHVHTRTPQLQHIIISEWVTVVMLMCRHTDTLTNLCMFVLATSDEEMSMWVKGLNWLVADTLRSPTPLQIERSVLPTDL